MKIDVLCSLEGSAKHVTPDKIEDGVGGAELSLMSWAEVMAQRGHEIRIYNDPKPEGVWQGVHYLDVLKFQPGEDRDALIAWRSKSPNDWHKLAKAGVKIHWSCDQFTTGNYKQDFVPFMDYIVTISPEHEAYYTEHYQPKKGQLGHIDLGVRSWEYEALLSRSDVKKVPNKLIFCSVPMRGLPVLAALWDSMRGQVPDLTLVITSDYRLWGVPQPLDHEHRLLWLNAKGVQYLGKIPRSELVRHQLEAQVMAYPCTYQELFCISAAECQVAGAVPVTSMAGALKTTNQWGIQIPGNPSQYGGWAANFVQSVTNLLSLMNDEGKPVGDAVAARAVKRFDWQVICSEWESLIQYGIFPAKEYGPGSDWPQFESEV